MDGAPPVVAGATVGGARVGGADVAGAPVVGIAAVLDGVVTVAVAGGLPPLVVVPLPAAGGGRAATELQAATSTIEATTLLPRRARTGRKRRRSGRCRARRAVACCHGGMSGKLPYWMHQLIEYLLGLLLLFEAARLKHPLLPAIAGVAIVLLGAMGDAPLSAFRTVRRPVHRTVDLVVGVVLLALGLVLWRSGGGAAMLVVVAVLLLILTWRTNYRPKGPKTPLRERLPDARMAGRLAGRATGKVVIAGRSRWRARGGSRWTRRP